jgi:hypothetical protein
MSQNQATSPIEASKKLVATMREAVHASRVEHATATALLEAVRSKYLDDSSAPNQKAVISAEHALRFCELRMTNLSKKLEAASAAHNAAEKAARLGEIAARQVNVNLATFDRAIAATVSKHSELLSKLDDVLSEERRLVAGFLSEQTSIARDAAALGAPVSPALDFTRIVQSRLMAARGSEAAEVLAEVWKATAPAGVDSQAALAAILGGVDAKKVASLCAQLLDAVRRLDASTVKLIQHAHVPLNPRADRTVSPLAQVESTALESEARRAALQAMGFQGASDRVQPLPITLKILEAGPAKVAKLVAALRLAPHAAFDLALDKSEADLMARRQKLGDDAAQALADLGLKDVADAERKPRAQSVARTIAPPDAPGFVELQVQS